MTQTEGQRVTRNTHNTHKCTHLHTQGHGIGSDTTKWPGQAAEFHGHKCLQTQAHKVVYPRSGTHTLFIQVLPPRARACLSSVLRRMDRWRHRTDLGQIGPPPRASPLGGSGSQHPPEISLAHQGAVSGGREGTGGGIALKPWQSLGTYERMSNRARRCDRESTTSQDLGRAGMRH